MNLDIEELKRAEEALRESEYKLRQIIETVPGLLWSTGPDGELTISISGFWTIAACDLRIFCIWLGGNSCTRTTFRTLQRLSHHAIQTGISYEAVHRLRRSDGEYRWHHARGEPLRDRQGRIVQWYGVSVDIDEGKRAEDRLRRSEAYLAEAQRLSHTGSFGWTPSTGELHWSDETFRMFEYDPSIKPTIERVLQRVRPTSASFVSLLTKHRAAKRISTLRTVC